MSSSRRAVLLGGVVGVGIARVAHADLTSDGAPAGTVAQRSPRRTGSAATPSGHGPRSEELDEARASRLDGDYRNAYIQFRLAERAAIDDAGRAAALIEAAETLLIDDAAEEAVDALDAWIDAFPTHPRQYVARTLRARALQSSTRPGAADAAVGAWREALYVSALPCAEAIRARLAAHLFTLGRNAEGWRELDATLAETAADAAPAGARLLAANAIAARARVDRDQRRANAIAPTVLDAMVRVGRLPADLAEAAGRAAGAALAAGDVPRADAIRWHLIEEWPETPVAWQSIGELGPTRVPAWTRARVAAANGKWETVRDATRWLLSNAPADPDLDKARALLGISANALGDARVDALLDEGSVEGAGRTWGARALWEAAERRRGSSDLSGAVDRYARLASTFPGTPEATQALYRLGRLLPGLGDPVRGTRAMNLAADTGAFSFQSVRARQVLRRKPSRPPATVEAFTASGALTAEDWAEWDRWLASRQLRTHDSDEDLSAPDLATRVNRLDGLLACGFLEEAEDAAREICQARQFGPAIVAAVASRVRDGGHVSFSMSLGLRLVRILDAAGESGLLGLPAIPRKLAYPIAYGRLVATSAAREGVDPYLLLAIMRQESWFDPRASSTGQARGLTQFIRPTAQAVARELKWPNWSWDDMFRPYVAIPFGARYVASLVKEFRGNVLFATAAYNAGPGPVLRWAGGDWERDPDLFVDGIDYRETRGYVTSVATYAEAFRDIYGTAW